MMSKCRAMIGQFPVGRPHVASRFVRGEGDLQPRSIEASRASAHERSGNARPGFRTLLREDASDGKILWLRQACHKPLIPVPVPQTRELPNPEVKRLALSASSSQLLYSPPELALSGSLEADA